MKKMSRLSSLVLACFFVSGAAWAEPVHCGRVVDVTETKTSANQEVSVHLRKVYSATYSPAEMDFKARNADLVVKLHAKEATSQVSLRLLASIARNSELLNYFACITWRPNRYTPGAYDYFIGTGSDPYQAATDLVGRPLSPGNAPPLSK